MNILHTSDWHLGRTLFGRKRDGEFEAFLAWLLATIEREQVDVLLVAGDVFDTTTPNHRVQTLYYRFLHQVAPLCRHVVITAGNHDSPSFLTAPKALLRAFNVHVVGTRSEDPHDDLLLLHDQAGTPELIVCAVPYLRDRDVRLAEAAESVEEKAHKMMEGIRRHYAEMAELAEQKRQASAREIPMVAMGHLFASGGQTVDGDGVRALYVGSLLHLSAAIFSPVWHYVALGHLHVPQAVNQSARIRYSGSPLPMGFGEAKQTKSVCLVTCTGGDGGDGGDTRITLLPVPRFQPLERIQGDWSHITDRIAALIPLQTHTWLEIIYTGDERIGDLRDRLAKAVQGTPLDIVRIQNRRIVQQALHPTDETETLNELDVHTVFQRCLEAHRIPDTQQPALLQSYREVVISLHEEDAQAG